MLSRSQNTPWGTGISALRLVAARRAVRGSRLMSSSRTPAITCSSAGAGSAPGWEKTSTPSRKAISVGIDLMPAAPASACSVSVFTLPNTMSGWPTGRLLEHRRERAARAAPGGPEVDEDDLVVGDRLLEVRCGQFGSSHANSSLSDTPRGKLCPYPGGYLLVCMGRGNRRASFTAVHRDHLRHLEESCDHHRQTRPAPARRRADAGGVAGPAGLPGPAATCGSFWSPG